MKVPAEYLEKLLSRYPEIYIKNIENIFRKARTRVDVKSLMKGSGLSENSTRDALNCKSACKGLLFLLVLRKTGISFEEVLKSDILLTGKTYSNQVKYPKELTEDLAYLVGCFRDGGLSKYKYEINITQRSRKWLEKLSQIIKREFGVHCQIYGPWKDNCFRLKIRSFGLWAIFKVLFEWEKLWKTPELIKTAPKNLQVAYIRGYWEAEGHNSKKGGLYFFQSSLSKKECVSLSDIHSILLGFHIESWYIAPKFQHEKYLHGLYIPKRHKEAFFSLTKAEKPVFDVRPLSSRQTMTILR